MLPLFLLLSVGSLWTNRSLMAEADEILPIEGGVRGSTMIMKTERKSENPTNEKPPGDNEDSESLEEQPLDIGEHYLVRRSDDSWRK